MTVPVHVLTADVAALATIRTAVNANRAELDPMFPAASADDTIVGCIQVGLNGLVDRNNAPNTSTTLPLLSVVGEAGATSNVTLDATLTARVTVVAALASCTEAELRALALHAGVLMMTGVATSAYRPSFV
jgi:hypothetical protein